MTEQLFYLRKIRYQYPESVRQKAIALYEHGGTTYTEVADFFDGEPCATTIRRWVLEDRFRRQALKGVRDE